MLFTPITNVQKISEISKNEYPHVKSQWVEHCLKGDFYEWIIKITGVDQFSVERMVYELGCIINVYYWCDDMDRRSKKNKMNKHRELIQQINNNEDKIHSFRNVVKQWMMEFLFSRFNMSSTEKCGNTIYKHFCHNLCQYLKEQEPYIYEKMTWFRRKENLIPKKSNPMKLTSQLPYFLQKEEVKFIKNCLRNLNDKSNISTRHMTVTVVWCLIVKR